MATWAWALDFQPVDKDGGADPAAVPIGDVLGASVSYGKRGDALTYSGGTMTLELDNTDSAYTPDAGGTYSNARFLGVEVKLYADVTGAGAPTWTHGPPAAFTGYVADIDYTFSDTYNATVTVTVVDALTMLGTLSFDGGSYGFTLDSSSDGILDTTRLGYDLTDGLDIPSGTAAAGLDEALTAATAVSPQIAQYAVVNPSGDAGQTLQAVVDYTGTAGALLTKIEHSNGGDVYVRHGLPIDGTKPYNSVTFRSRGQLPVSEAVTGVNELTALNLFDARLATSGTEPHYFASIDFASGSTTSYSQASFTSIGGTEQTTSANIDQFGARSINRSGLLCVDDAQTLSVAESFLAQYGTDGAPPLNVRDIKMQPITTGSSDSWQLVKYSVGDTCSIQLRPEGSTATLDFTGVVSGIKWAITPQSSTLTVQLEDGVQLIGFILDSTDYGVLDTDTLGF
ncbi:MAG: hypothetical protein ACPHDT_15290 [Acidimicrobiales bacterium]